MEITYTQNATLNGHEVTWTITVKLPESTPLLNASELEGVLQLLKQSIISK